MIFIDYNLFGLKKIVKMRTYRAFGDQLTPKILLLQEIKTIAQKI